jgi:hypothetical protein
MRRRRSPPGGIWFDYFPTFVLALLFGFGTELSQVVTHRDPAMRDVMLDVRGIVCALALLLSFDPRLGMQRWSAHVRVGLRALVVLLVLGTLAPIAWVTSAYISRAITAPTLFEPRSDLDLLLVSLTDTAPELAKLPAPFSRFADEKGLRVPLTSRPYAGVSLDEPIGDWRRYRTLQIDLTNPTRSELQLHLRIQDRLNNGEVTDRFEAIERLSPGTRRTVEVPLEQVATGPRDRRLDLGQVTGVFLYKAGAEGAREMWLGRMSLQ